MRRGTGIRSLHHETAGESAGAADFNQLAEAVEKAIKAALIESHGSLPQQHDHSQLVSISPINRRVGRIAARTYGV